MLADENLKVELCVSHPSTPNKLQLKYEIRQNPHGSCQEIVQKFGVSHKTIQSHLHNHRMMLKLSKWLPHVLSVEICFDWLSIVAMSQQSLISELNIDILRKKGHVWQPEEKTSLVDFWFHLVVCQTGNKKIMLYVWWTRDTIVHYEFLESGKTITVDVYSL